MSASPHRTALILSGGGARAAYHAGVLKAAREMLPDPRHNPFPILCGTSAGAINAAVIASRAENFGAGVNFLLDFWSRLRAGDVYRADAAGLLYSSVRWLALLAAGRLFGGGPRSFLDNAPLRRLLAESIDFSGIERAVSGHAVHAVGITCSGFNSGQSVTFFQGRADLEPWQRGQRVGAHVKLELDHLMASMAIPFVFPAVKLHREWFGDGALRQLTPISPAVHFGADRILAIDPGPMAALDADRESTAAYPSLAQVAGHALSGIYVDSLSMDLERVVRINRTLAFLPDEARRERGVELRPIEVLTITPSIRFDHLAAEHENALPWTVRRLLAVVGGRGREGGAFTSYLLFEESYIRALIDLGYRDTMARRDEVAAFLGLA